MVILQHNFQPVLHSKKEVFDAFVKHKTNRMTYDDAAPLVNEELKTNFVGGTLKKRYNDMRKTMTRKATLPYDIVCHPSNVQPNTNNHP
jgi:hypothetical protein